MFIKKTFFRFSIQRQISLGVTLILILTFILLILLVMINLYSFMARTNKDIMNYLEDRDSEYVNSIALLYDFNNELTVDSLQLQAQYLRNIKNNFEMYKNYYSDISKGSFDKYFIDGPISSPTNCREDINQCYYSYSDFDNTKGNDDEKLFLMLLIPLLHNIINFQTKDDTNLFNGFSYSSNTLSKNYFFPITEEISKFSKSQLFEYFTANKELLKNHYINNNKTYFALLNKYEKSELYDIDIKFSNFTRNNPLLYLDAYNNSISYPNRKENDFNRYLISYDAYVDNENKINFDNYFLLGINKDLMDEMALEITDIFPPTQVIKTFSLVSDPFNKDYASTLLSCMYFRKLVSILTNTENKDEFNVNSYENISSLIPIDDCFADENFKILFDVYFYNPQGYLEPSNTIMKAIIPLKLKGKDNNFPFDTVNFKILKVYSSVFISQGILSLKFINYVIGKIYVIHNNSILNGAKTDIFYFILSLFSFVIFYVFILVIVLSVITYLLGRKLSLEISKPIKELIKRISFKKIQKDNNDKLEIDKISKEIFEYKYDSDINELFHICYNFIKGGFNKLAISKKNKIINSYNNIALVKSNNLIIDEKRILNEQMERNEMIFHYGEKTPPTGINSKNKDVNNENILYEDLSDLIRELDLRELFDKNLYGLNEEIIAKNEDNKLFNKLLNILKEREQDKKCGKHTNTNNDKESDDEKNGEEHNDINSVKSINGIMEKNIGENIQE